MRLAVNYAFSKLEDFSREPENESERHQRELESRVAEALEHGYQRGYEAGRTEFEVASGAEINAIKTSCASEISTLQAQWQATTGTSLVEALQSRLDGISEMLEEHVATLMKPLINDVLYRRSLQDFHDALEGIIETGIAVEIRGSRDLVRGVEERLGSRCEVKSIITTEDAVIEVKCDETMISANFTEWFAKIDRGLT